MADLEKKFGAERLKPHRDALVTAGLNIRASLVLFAIIGFVASFAISLGPVMWVLLSEIFPNQYRGMAMSLVGFWNSVVSASVTFIFPWELSHFGSAGTFLGYGLMAAAALVFVLLFIPETKGKTLEELEGILMRKEKHMAPVAEHTTSNLLMKTNRQSATRRLAGPACWPSLSACWPAASSPAAPANRSSPRPGEGGNPQECRPFSTLRGQPAVLHQGCRHRIGLSRKTEAARRQFFPHVEHRQRPRLRASRSWTGR